MHVVVLLHNATPRVSPRWQQHVTKFVRDHEPERVTMPDRLMIDRGADAFPQHIDTPGIAVRLREYLPLDVLDLDKAVRRRTSQQHHVDCELEDTSTVVGLR